MDANKLDELADRVERLTGPDREVDHEIALAFKAPDWRKLKPWKRTNGWAKPDNALDAWAVLFYDTGGNPYPVEHYTKSLDAAMTLVPEGLKKSLLINIDVVTQVHLYRHGVAGRGDAATPALALTAACLRALAKGN